MIVLWFLVLFFFLFVLLKSADYFIDNAVLMGNTLKIPSFVLGATIIAFGTSLPELAVSISAILKNTPAIISGTVIGSNISNVFLILGIAFIWYQYVGFNQLKDSGLYFTGKGSTVSTSFIIGITLMHVFHLIAGVIVLLVVIYNHFKNKYKSTEMLGFELGAIFWHFVDVLWIYLFFFFYFIR